MNLKEAFRYQNYLNSLASEAEMELQRKDNALKETRKHKVNKVNPEEEDFEEVVEPSSKVYPTDTLIDFVLFLIGEKLKLSLEIDSAKADLALDIDAEIATNKVRHDLISAMHYVLFSLQETKTVETGLGYKFNVEGNQTPYKYDIEVVKTAAFDRERDKKILKRLNARSDEVSNEIDKAIINTTVEYDPPFEVGEHIDDAIQEFLERGLGEYKK